MEHTFANAEQVGTAFSMERMLGARALTSEAVAWIAAAIEPGMNEEEALAAAQQVLEAMGVERCWHPTAIRFGANTVKTFREPSGPGVKLAHNDIFFVDIGPLWDGHEGDGGDTFVLGHDDEMHACAEAAWDLFERVRAYWLAYRATGRELYAFAARTATEMGWVLNQKVAGHRVADFPHMQAGTLASQDFCPSSGLWVLEIQIRHPVREFGAFFEDLLVG
ncbi:M24 family metallopeptidase [Crenobacter sp. SG2305]|uniref:M24 family metallopeptidase n=1 Tax=Crenobacter oryzisoli TaxID=3056844 RepID=UPI0025AAC3FC|nr:M24 family metallopeptidase [Crenobacter sp. SG2305]MDN0085683.1 M24 family metallopeptidase [Crenobacter sp. SG2305]